MQKVLFDTSLYIAAFRTGNSLFLSTRSIAPDSPVWLSSVVLEELYAGADVSGHRGVELLEQGFGRLKRIVVPNLTDWTRTGRVLSRLASKYDYEQIGRDRLTNDA